MSMQNPWILVARSTQTKFFNANEHTRGFCLAFRDCVGNTQTLHRLEPNNISLFHKHTHTIKQTVREIQTEIMHISTWC
jgi:hypothetical protein